MKELLTTITFFGLSLCLNAQAHKVEFLDSGSLATLDAEYDMALLEIRSNCDAADLGTELYFSGKLRNKGSEILNSFDFVWTFGNQKETEKFSGLNLATGQLFQFEHSVPFTLVQMGSNQLNFSIENPNGETDESIADNTDELELTGVSIFDHQNIVAEEATGTWCGWCPRGAVLMDRMKRCFGDHFIGIAVHDDDPMTLPAYNNGVISFPGFDMLGFPSILTDRNKISYPEDLIAPINEKLSTAPEAIIGISFDWNEDSRELKVTASAEMKIATITGYKWVGVLTEDHVTGTSNEYDQANYYYEGSFGQVGGYENLPNPVPASIMIYDNVGRALLAGYAGVADSGLDNLEPGDMANFEFDAFTIPADQDVSKMDIVVMLLDPNGEVVNANSMAIDETTPTRELNKDTDVVEIFPNPFSDLTNIRVKLIASSQVKISVSNSLGQIVAQKNYGMLEGDLILPFPTHHLSSGSYFIQLFINDKRISKKIQIVKVQ